MLAKDPNDRPSSVRDVADELRIIGSDEHADERTSIIPASELIEQNPSLSRPENDSLPRLRMSQSIDLTDDFKKKLGDWNTFDAKKPGLKKDLTQTPSVRDPRDLITRISAIASAPNNSKDPFEHLDRPKVIQHDSTAPGEGKNTQEPSQGSSARNAQKSPAMPVWFKPLGLLLGSIWLLLAAYYYFKG
jgi:hypothetical protein